MMEHLRQERFDLAPAPDGPEALGAAVLLSVAAFVLVPLGVQGVAARATAGRFAWPHGRLVEAYAGLLDGRFGVGLDRTVRDDLPSNSVLWTLSAAAEVAIFALSIAVLQHRRRLSNGDAGHGLATSAQAAQALGRRPLRHRASVIRPDLKGRSRRRGLPTSTALGRKAPTPKGAPHLRPAANKLALARSGKARGARAVHSGPEESGWRLGRAGRTGPTLWVPFDRTACVIGPQGSGKTLDLLAPSLLHAPGGALVTLTKPEDLFLTMTSRGGHDDHRPVVVLDPFDLAPGTPQLVWNPIAGCQDPLHAERRAKAFAAGTIKSATAHSSDQAARFYAGECAKVLQAYLHAAAIAGLDLDAVLTWVSAPRQFPQPEEILRTHPDAEPLWDGLLRGALFGDERTAGNTITTVQQALALFFQSSIRARCTPSDGRAATDLARLIESGGTIYLLGREDPYSSASPLMTAVTEDVLDTAKQLGESSPHGRLCPPFLACLDELPSTAPIPTLATRMANERALGTAFIIAAQTWRQLVVSYGEDQARTILGLSNNLVIFGGGKDIRFYQELSELIGSTTHTEVRHSRRGDRWSAAADRSFDRRRVPILEPAELRRLEERTALVLAESYPPIIASLRRCIDGRRGRPLLAQQEGLRRYARAAATDTPGRDADGAVSDTEPAARRDQAIAPGREPTLPAPPADEAQ